MTTGTVKFFNDSKGYGLLLPRGGQDAFVHVSALESSGMRSLSETQRVSYDLEQDRRGKITAVNLKDADSAPQSSADGAGGPANEA